MELTAFIKDLCRKGESTEIEFKSAAGGFPGSFWETYSAFGNTDGGIIVLGIKEKNHKFFPDRLSKEQITRYKKQYWDDVNNHSKVSICLTQDKDVIDTEFEGSAILVVHIPRAIYSQRPVYLTFNPFGHTFVRRHEGDYLLGDDGVRTMFADSQAKSNPLDRKIVRNFKLGDDIDITTVHQYRQVFKGKHDDHPWNQLEDIDFLTKIGAYGKDKETGDEGFTLAGVLVFGTWQGILDALPNYYIDYRERLSSDPAVRWTDRVYPDGYWEPNLYQFYTRVYMKMYSALPVPFKLENGSRVDDTPAHKALREAIVNTIVHSNFFLSSTITIDRYPDRLVFANPGSMLVSVEQYFEGGTSVSRNATIQKIFGFIGGGERAGSGADTIAKGWEFNHWPKPRIREKYDPDRVELTLMIGQNSSRDYQGSTTPDTTPGTTPIEEKQNTREKIIQIIKSTPNVSTLGLAKMCGITKDGAKYHLTKLKKEGKIRYSKEDGGIWIVNE